MALLRNREVQILRTAVEIDESSFQVRYPDGETEIAKMHELIFTPEEYNTFVRQELPEVRVMDQKKVADRVERTRAEETEDDKKRREAQEKAAEEAPEAIKPDVLAAQGYSPKNDSTNNNQAPKTQKIDTRSTSDTSKPSTLPGLSRNQPVNKTPASVVNK